MGAVMALSSKQKENYDYFLEHLKEWLDNVAYKDKYVVIYDKDIKYVQDDFTQAFKYGISHFPRKDFIVQQVISEDSINSFLKPAI